MRSRVTRSPRGRRPARSLAPSVQPWEPAPSGAISRRDAPSTGTRRVADFSSLATRVDVLLLAPPAIPVLGDVMRYTVSPLLMPLAWPSLMRLLFGPAPTNP